MVKLILNKDNTIIMTTKEKIGLHKKIQSYENNSMVFSIMALKLKMDLEEVIKINGNEDALQNQKNPNQS